ncbi:DUF4012 domain-containing protein [Cellulomonas sp. DKR-3]|uniref:DUF4012 domain-containing protein n=1 Tax=Cellulomonas fulva TaxID=2835530 RepID=A0ABS5TV66_9CELL|nr:DUF4012 domain-containing protein [Cellulomonas fulva]MBT0993038.1 DUF4012 domain-containing protein [Cellulomonas fulva]
MTADADAGPGTPAAPAPEHPGPTDDQPSDDHFADDHLADEPGADERAADGGDADGRDGAEPGAGGRRRRRWPRRVALTIVVLLVLLVVALAWVGYRAVAATDALQDARSALGRVEQAQGTDRLTALDDAVPALQEAAGRATEQTRDPVWRVAEHAPWLGAQLAAVRAVGESLDQVAADALPTAVGAGDLLAGGGLRTADGRVDVDAIAAVAPGLADGSAAATQAAARVSGVDRDALVGPLADAVGQADDALTELASTLTSAARTTRLLPPMLGADGPRTYLVLALNSAELRAQGGIVGALIELRVDDGRVELVRQVAGRDVPVPRDPVVDLSEGEVAVSGTSLARYVQDASGSPDFPRTAQIARELWAGAGGGEVDGVIATDPTTVRLVLRATGPLEVADGSKVRGSTFLQTSLRDVYLENDDDELADAYFADVAAAVLGAVASGTGDSDALVAAAAQAVDERRVRVWSAHDDEQEVLAGTTVGGAFLSGAAPGAVGVFLDDATTGKLDYDLTADVTVEDLVCTGASPSATVRVDLSYDPPDDVATWRRGVLGIRDDVVPPGWLATRVSVYAPAGAAVAELRQDDAIVGSAAEVAGRDVRTTSVLLAPGESTTIRATVPVVDGRVDVWTTPTLAAPGAVDARCVG